MRYPAFLEMFAGKATDCRVVGNDARQLDLRVLDCQIDNWNVAAASLVNVSKSWLVRSERDEDAVVVE